MEDSQQFAGTPVPWLIPDSGRISHIFVSQWLSSILLVEGKWQRIPFNVDDFTYR